MSDDRHDNADKPGDLNPDDFDAQFSDAELEAALAGFEQEFRDAQEQHDTDATDDSEVSDVAGSVDAADSSDAADDGAGGRPDDLSSQFEDELAGLLGNKAKAAVIITRIASAQLLAAFCQLSDISADCVESPEGAVAVLRGLDGDGPEAAAKDLTTVVDGMAVVLAVNRADKLEATMYLRGKPGETFAPPILFSSTAPFVEDLMLGIGGLDSLKAQGTTIVASSGMTHDQAMQVLAKHTRFGRGGSRSIQ
ncbi:hypothetical protein JS533_000105 [Bifidobacterium amazonense]|uniref:Uncharacterized protein n=1 Tax=Bifidobacterium amazonense TaxID=2809027 RepID=A0ABS9VRC5_9BIFI|nr:hypothetical protein [Bifidobacterium amazonense]MCH9274697.1 hypothetical protein [Bifidobacterium amazonense]